MTNEYLDRIKEGAVVADVGCGIGYLTYILSGKVGDTGKVYAVDINESVLHFVDVVKKKEGLKNITTIKSKPDDICLPPNSCDQIWLVGTIHILDSKINYSFINSCYSALKKNGFLIVVEWRLSSIIEPTMEIARKIGFRRIEKETEFDPLGRETDRYVEIYQKK
ncbi:MAG: class I SAM-dependent methyltransferase [Candidatus Eremiobacteraeota bacterium]|nr:class I SAM-dependent methyltransferase [Candidatus Eremiobacteraeota bacterium]